MLTERKIIGVITILDDGLIQLREDTVIDRDGVEIYRIYHRRVLEPGVGVSTESVRVRQITSIIWTPDVINKYREEKIRKAAELLTGRS